MSIRKILEVQASFSVPPTHYNKDRCNVVCFESKDSEDDVALEVESGYENHFNGTLYLSKEAILAMAKMFVEEDDDS